VAAIAAESERARIKGESHGFSELVHSPAVAAALVSGAIAAVVALVGPTLARGSFLSLGDAFVGRMLKLHPQV
jgi:hypothetical protein